MKAYFSELKSSLKYTLLIFIIVVIIDYFDLPSKLLKYGFLLYAGIAFVIFIIIYILQLGLLHSVKLPIINSFDAWFLCIGLSSILLTVFSSIIEGYSYKVCIYSNSNSYSYNSNDIFK